MGGREREVESDGPEDAWVHRHGDALVGLPAAEAAEAVRAAGFRPFVHDLEGGVAVAATHVAGSVRLLCADREVRRVRAG